MINAIVTAIMDCAGYTRCTMREEDIHTRPEHIVALQRALIPLPRSRIEGVRGILLGPNHAPIGIAVGPFYQPTIRCVLHDFGVRAAVRATLDHHEVACTIADIERIDLWCQ